MLFITIIKVALRSLLANKLRSFLAVLGIIIGVAAVIANLAIGTGAHKQIVDRISAMGSNLLMVRPSWRRTGGVRKRSIQRITLDDATAILEKIPGLKFVSPVVHGNVQVKYFNKNSPVEMLGIAPTFFAVRNFELERGRMFTDAECSFMSHVAILGPDTAGTLFGTNAIPPIGEMIKVNGDDFKLVGVTKRKGDQGWHSPDDQILLPYATAMKQVLGVRWLDEINVQVAEGVDMNKVSDLVGDLLRKLHHLAPKEEDDFIIRNQAELLETADSVSRTFTVLLGAVAGISLLVGGIGIMNIMLVTVTERTREIGIRKAIGAKKRDILYQFLLESMTMSAIGGVVGVCFGVGAAWIVGRATQYITVVQPFSIIMALLVSTSVGIFFGLYPARRAALLAPIDALRYE